jgi:putative YhdH/YhfP family quinone oxidoreductase
MTVDELDPGDVVIKTKYSTINYKDALSYNGAGKIMRKYPTNAGIDMAGTVESSADPRWKRGDKVIVHAYDMGVAHDGGYSERVRVPGDWIVRRPESMTAFDAMTLGTAGFTAAQAITLMEHNGLKPDNGPVAVTGATGGVGSVAVEILAKTGYEVVAITGKKEETRYLKSLGAKDVLLRQSIDLSKIRPLDKSTWAGAIDNLGGDLLAWLLSTMKIGGTVGAVGLAADMKLNTTSRRSSCAVLLLGADSANCPMPVRQKIWNKLAVEWRPDQVRDQVRTIDFDDLPTHFDPYLKGWSGARSYASRPTRSVARPQSASTRREIMARTRSSTVDFADRDAFWREEAALIDWQAPFSAVLDYEAAQMVRRRTHEPLPQRRRSSPASRGEQRALVYLSTETASSVHVSRAFAEEPPPRCWGRRARARATVC